MTDRPLKRAWLRLVGVVDDREPSGSIIQPININSIDSTLGAVKGDDIWVALACIDAIQTRRDLADNIDICRHLLQIGLRCSDLSDDFNLNDKPTMHTLTIRNQLHHQMQLLDIWEQLYGSSKEQEADNTATLMSADDIDGDHDAWADVTETTPSPLPINEIPINLADFLQQDILKHIMHLAAIRDAKRVHTFIKVLPRSIIRILYPHRLTLTTALISSFALAKNDLNILLQLKLLPGILEQSEAGLIVDCINTSSIVEDITTRDDIQDLISSQSYKIVSEGKEVNGELSSSQLLGYYNSRITSLHSQSGTLTAAVQLAEIINSGQLGLQVDDSFRRLTTELQLLLPLTRMIKYKDWTLEMLRTEIVNRPDLGQKQKLASRYLEDSQTVFDTSVAARTGAVPFLNYLNKKYASQTNDNISEEETALSAGFLQATLNLADEGNFKVVRYILESGSKCGVELKILQWQKIALSCSVGVTMTGESGQAELSNIVRTVLSKSKADHIQCHDHNDKLPFLRSTGESRSPSEIYTSLFRMGSPAILHQLCRYHDYAIVCQSLSRWYDELSPGLLASVQGRNSVQIDLVTRIIQSFTRKSAKSNDQWKSLIDTLIHDATTTGTFDALLPKDIMRIIFERALRADDPQIFSQNLKGEIRNYFDLAEEEEIILSASQEYYNNASSANVHQGDMKIAYEILSLQGPPLTPRVEREKAFIESTSRLCSFRFQSHLRSGGKITPTEIRLSVDRLDFIKQLLESNEFAYKTPELILEMAIKLCAVPSGSKTDLERDSVPSKVVIESRTLALLTEAALGQADYTQAQVSCERLVNNITSLSKRLEQSRINKGSQHDQLESQFRIVGEVAYKSCFLLSNQHEWKSYVTRLRWASFVLAFCPEDQIDKYLKSWRRIEDEYQQDLVENPPLNSWNDQMMNGQLKSSQYGVGSGLGASLAAIGNLSALESLGPFGNLFASAKMQTITPSSSRSNAVDDAVAKDDKKDEVAANSASRAARLFDSIGGGSGGASEASASPNMTYLDPAERAARAARRFFGGFGS